MRQIVFKMILLSILIAQPLYAQEVAAASLPAAANEGTITGRVTDESDKAIAGVSINVWDNGHQSQGHAQTDSTGKYIIDNLFPDRNYYLEICSPADMNLIRQRMENIFIKSGTTTIINICMLSGGIITGTITDTKGNPVEEVEINVPSNYTDSDSNGQYTIKGLSTGIYTVTAIPPSSNHDLAPLRIEGVSVTKDNITVLNLILPIAGTLTGYIKDKMGNPVANARISIGGKETQSQSDGRYTCYNLSPGTYSLTTNAPQNSILIGKTIQDIPIIAANTTIQDVVLDTGGIITGVIRDADLNPVANVSVSVSGEIINSWIWRDTRSDINGSYTIYNLPPGTYTIAAMPSADVNLIKQTFQNIIVQVGATTTQDFILQPGGIIMGTITDESGKPIGNVQVNVKNSNKYTRCNVNGQYIIKGLPTGMYSIEVTPATDVNLIKQTFQNIIVQVGATTTQDFILQPGGIIMGTITDESGKPIGNVQVNTRESSRYTRCNVNGQYIIKGLPTGMYSIEVTPDKGVPYFKKVINGVAIVGEITEQDIMLSKGGIISGEIIDDTNDGKRKEFAVFAFPADKKLTIDNFEGFNPIHIDGIQSGHYSLTPIPPGNYDIYWSVIYGDEYQHAMTFFKSSSNINITKDTYVTGHTLTIGSILSGISGTATSFGKYDEIIFTNLNNEVVGFAEPDNSTGRYSILYLYPGTYSVWTEDEIKIQQDIIVEEGKITIADISSPTPPRIGTITGLVKDMNEKPISGVVLILTRANDVIATTTTDAKGTFLFYIISAGWYQLKVSKEGYMTNMIKSVYLYANETEIINITLQSGDGIAGIIYKYEKSELLLGNKVRLILPPNSINTGEEIISITKVKDTDIPPVLSLGINIKPINIAYDFKPDNLRFTNQATITLYYTPEDPEGLDEDKLAIFYYNGTKWVYVGGKVNKEENTISFQTNHLSLYAIMEYSPLTNLDRVICYPNPFYPDKGNTCIITGIPYDAQDVKVSIYNIAGELVKVFEQDEIQEGVDCKFVEWNGTNEYNYKTAYGIYIYVVKSTKGSSQGKIALIR